MKKFYSLVILTCCWCLIATSSLFAQNAPIDFEVGGNGADWTWTVFENSDNPPVNIVANPDMSGANTSASVAEFTARTDGNPWAGTETMHGADIGTFTLTPANSLIKIMVWKSTISDVGIKLVAADGGALPEIKVANTLINQWEELTFDFSSQEEGAVGAVSPYDQIVVFPDFTFDGRPEDNVVYFDNITFNAQSTNSVLGCMDPAATNYNPAATQDDGSCQYPTANNPNAPIDFEAGGNGADWTWTVFENDDNPPVVIAPNPDASGINTSPTVACFTARMNGNPWAGTETMHGADIGTFTLTPDNSLIKIMVWKSTISDVGIKLVAADGGALPEIKVANTLVNQWEELTFDFTSQEAGMPGAVSPYDQIVVFPDFTFDGRPEDNLVYFDNITFNSQNGVSPIAGCTDPAASNYDSEANEEDGSCLYLCAVNSANPFDVSIKEIFNDGSGLSYSSNSGMGLSSGANNAFAGTVWNVSTAGFSASDIAISIDFTVTGDAAAFPRMLEFRIENNACGGFPCPWNDFNTLITEPGTYTLGGVVSAGNASGAGAFDPEGANPALVAAIANFDGSPLGGNIDVTYSNLCVTDLSVPVPGCTDASASNYNADASEEDGSCLYLCSDDPADLLEISNAGGFDAGSGLSYGSNSGMGLLAGANNDFAGHIWNTNTAGLTNEDFCISVDYTVTGDAAAFPITLEFRIENNGCGGFPCPWNDFNTSIPGPGTYTLGGIVSTGNASGAGAFDPNGANPSIVAAIANFSGTPLGGNVDVAFSNLCVSTDCGADVPGCDDSAANNYNPDATINDGSCLYNFNFEVDMNCWDGNDPNIELTPGYPGFSGVSVEGPLFGWCGGCAALTDDDADGVWTGTFELPLGQFEYKYAIDGFAGQEQLIDDVAAGGTCAPVTDGVNFANRQIAITPNGTISDTYGTCGTCEPTPGCTDSAASNYNSDANEDDGSCYYLCSEDPDNLFNISNNGGFDAGSGLSYGSNTGMGLLTGANNDFAGFIWNVTTAGLSASEFCMSMDFAVSGDAAAFPITVEFRIENNGCGGFPCPWNDFNTLITEPGTYNLGGIISAGNAASGGFDPNGANPSIVAAIANFSGTPMAGNVDVAFSNLCVSTDCGIEVLGCADSAANNYNPDATLDDGSCLYNFNFEVDMNCWDGNDPNIELSAGYPGFSGVSVEGPLFNWCGGCAPLSDDNGDGIWTGTFELPLGQFEYKYAIDGFAGQEQLVDNVLAGETCAPVTDGANFANRLIDITPNGTISDAYGSCSACVVAGSGCTDPWAVNYDADATIDDGSCMYNVTFVVDMNCQSDFTTPYVTGPFANWCGDCHPMQDDDGDGLWIAVIPFPANTLVEYKYEVDNWASQEDLIDDMIAGADCAPVTDFATFANRTIQVENMAAVASDVYDTCGDCDPYACEPSTFPTAPQNLDEQIASAVTLLTWNEVLGSTACQVQGNVVGSATFPLFLVQGDAPSAIWVNNLNLNDGATYQWRVRCGCSASPVIATPWSDWSYFTYNALLPVQSNMQLKNTSIFPNPNNGDFNLSVDAEGEGVIEIRVYNLLGSVVYNSNRAMQSSKETFQISLEGQNKGIYFVDVISETSKMTKKVILE